MTGVRGPFAASDKRHVPQGKAGRLLELAERDVSDEREDVALEGGEGRRACRGFIPLSGLPLPGDVGLCAASSRSISVSRIGTRRLLFVDRNQAGAVERLLVLLALVLSQCSGMTLEQCRVLTRLGLR